MKLLRASVLSGWNVHHEHSVIRQEVDLQSCADLTSAGAGHDFAKRFTERFDALPTFVPVPDGGMDAEFLARLHSTEGAPLAEVLLEAIAAVERSMAFAMHRLHGIGFQQVAPGSKAGRALLVWRCRVPGISRRTAAVALLGVEELLPESLRRAPRAGARDFDATLRALSRLARQSGRLSPSTTLLADAADRRGIPWEWLGRQHLRLGQGAFQQQVLASMTGDTSFQAMRLASDKQITHDLLEDLRLPVPRQALVDTLEEALGAARTIGYPLAVKPLTGKKGGGVTAGVRDADELRVAFERAARNGDRVLVEAFVPGDDHRLLVIHGRFVAAVRRVPPAITGDGRSSIAELVEELNRDPYRDELRRCRVTLDDELARLLARAGHRLETVLPEGEVLALRSTANVSTGGCAIDVTDEVHPDNREMAVRAIEAVGLDVGGVDFLTEDIRRSYRQGGGIVEVNARPGLRPHTWPVEGASRDVASTLVEALFPNGSSGRVPVAIIGGADGSGLAAHALDQLLRSAGTTVGLVTTDGAFVNGEPAGPEKASRPRATRALLRDPRVETFVSTASPRQLVARGIGHEQCEVAAILGTTTGARSGARALRGFQLLAQATRGTLVIRAGSRRAMRAVEGVDPDRLILISSISDNVRLLRHVESGGRAVMVATEQGERVIVLAHGSRTLLSLPIKAVPALSVRATRQRVEAQLFAVALAHGLGLAPHEIVFALRNGRPAPRSRRASAVAPVSASASA
ncbi:MAG: ATP-grasp domain-containing protein [Myxococcota bacterium]|nr:ATP-grasp domain-containing protein [Myxococcota bacterium]